MRRRRKERLIRLHLQIMPCRPGQETHVTMPARSLALLTARVQPHPQDMDFISCVKRQRKDCLVSHQHSAGGWPRTTSSMRRRVPGVVPSGKSSGGKKPISATSRDGRQGRRSYSPGLTV